MTLDEVLSDIGKEECRDTLEHPPFSSPEVGFACMLDVFSGFRNAVASKDAPAEMRQAAIQIAATAARFVLDVCEERP